MPSSYRSRRILAVIAVLVPLIACLGVFSLAHQHDQATAATAVNPRLILSPQQVLLRGALPGGVQVTGSLYPGFPGENNTVHLTVRDASGQALRGGQIVLTITMPGMRMRPVHSVLHVSGSGYDGVLAVPMFGAYRARLAVRTPAGSVGGAFMFSMPIPGL